MGKKKEVILLFFESFLANVFRESIVPLLEEVVGVTEFYDYEQRIFCASRIVILFSGSFFQ